MKRFTLSFVLALVLVAMAPSARATMPPMWGGQAGKPHDPYTGEPYTVTETGFTATRQRVLGARGSDFPTGTELVRAWRIAHWPRLLVYIYRLRGLR